MFVVKRHQHNQLIRLERLPLFLFSLHFFLFVGLVEKVRALSAPSGE